MTAQPLLSSTILIRVMTVFLFVLTQKRVMAPFNDNVLGLMRVMCGTRVTLLSFGTREYAFILILTRIFIPAGLENRLSKGWSFTRCPQTRPCSLSPPTPYTKKTSQIRHSFSLQSGISQVSYRVQSVFLLGSVGLNLS